MAEQSLKINQSNSYPQKDKVMEASLSSEARIWIDFLHGSDSAVADLYHLYANKLFNYGRQFTRNEDLILDAVQDVFLNLIRTRDKLSVATCVKFYLYSSFRRSLVRQVKRANKIDLHDNMEDEGFQITIDQNYLSVNTNIHNDQKKIIERFCNKLPPRQREAIVLHYFEDLDYAEIAKTMNLLNSKSARTIVYRALDSLSKLLSTWKKELTLVTGVFSSLFI
jgi:RNA polymerase sigma factor (sigma-70 family)